MSQNQQEVKGIIRNKSLEVELVRYEKNLQRIYFAILPQVFGKDIKVEINPKREYKEILVEIKKKIELMERVKLEKTREQLKKEVYIDILSLLAKLEEL